MHLHLGHTHPKNIDGQTVDWSRPWFSLHFLDYYSITIQCHASVYVAVGTSCWKLKRNWQSWSFTIPSWARPPLLHWPIYFKLGASTHRFRSFGWFNSSNPAYQLDLSEKSWWYHRDELNKGMYANMKTWILAMARIGTARSQCSWQDKFWTEWY